MSLLGTTNLNPKVFFFLQELLKVHCRPVFALLMRAGFVFHFRFTELCSRSQGSLVRSGAKMPIIYTMTGIGNRQPQRRIWPHLGSASHVGSALQMCILAPVNPSNGGLQCKCYSKYSNSKQFTENGNIFGLNFNIFIPPLHSTPPSHKRMCVGPHAPSITRQMTV